MPNVIWSCNIFVIICNKTDLVVHIIVIDNKMLQCTWEVIMFLKRERKIVGLVLAGCLAFTAEFEALAANKQSETQTEGQAIVANIEMEMSPVEEVWEQIPTLASVAVDTQEWNGKALANTDSEMNVYSEASEESAVAGIAYNNTIFQVEEVGTEWTKVSSGSVSGYVKNEWIVTGTAAVERAKTVCAEGTKDAKTIEEIAEEKRQQELQLRQQRIQQAQQAAQAQPQSVDVETLLAALIYCEAGNQPYDGQVAVGAVVMNRVASGRFPNTIQEVIYQRGQFTPAMTGKLGRVLASGNIPASCFQAARDALNGHTTVGNALFFNTSHGSFKLGDHYFS